MKLRRFHPIFDLAWYNSWLTERNLKPLTICDIPGIGYIAENPYMIVAALFLRKVEGGLGMVDGLCTNPSADPADRFQANDMLIERILNKAKGLGMKNVLAWSIDNHTLMRSVRHGFSQSQYALLTRDLSLEVKPWHSLKTYSAAIREQASKPNPPPSPIL